MMFWFNNKPQFYRLVQMYYKIKPGDDIGKNCGFALLSKDGIKKLTPVFGGRSLKKSADNPFHQSRRNDIFQL